MNKRSLIQDHYYLWALERVGMLYDLQTIGDKDWYRWGAEILVTNQSKRGWWRGAATPEEVKSEVKSREYGALLNTAFALLFLKRSHPMKDLTPKLPFTANELNEGMARLRPSDKFPVRTTSTSREGTTSSESKPSESQSRNRDP